MSKEKIFEKAKEIGDLIAHSEEKDRASEANRALSADKEAIDLISGYNEKRQKKIDELDGRQPSAEEAREIDNYLQNEFNKIAENAIIREYIEANRAFENMLNQMDQIIKSSISGGHSCGGECSSCSGCC